MSACQYVRLRALSEWRAAERIFLKFQIENSLTRARKSQNRGIPIFVKKKKKTQYRAFYVQIYTQVCVQLELKR